MNGRRVCPDCNIVPMEFTISFDMDDQKSANVHSLLPFITDLKIVVLGIHTEEQSEGRVRLFLGQFQDSFSEAKPRPDQLESTRRRHDRCSPLVDKQSLPSCNRVGADDGMDRTEVQANVVGMSTGTTTKRV